MTSPGRSCTDMRPKSRHQSKWNCRCPHECSPCKQESSQRLKDAQDQTRCLDLDNVWSTERGFRMSDDSREVISNILNWDEELQTFLQSKGTKDLDASVPLMPLIRFISPVDSMWRSTVKVIEARLVEDTLIRRYEAERTHVAGGEVAHCVLILVHRIPLARVGSWKSLNYCLRNSGDTRIILGSTRKLVQAGNISVTSHGHAAPSADQYRNIWFKRLILRPDGKDRGKIPRLECLRRRHRIPLQPGRTPDSQKAGNDQRRLVRGS